MLSASSVDRPVNFCCAVSDMPQILAMLCSSSPFVVPIVQALSTIRLGGAGQTCKRFSTMTDVSDGGGGQTNSPTYVWVRASYSTHDLHSAGDIY